MTDVPPDAPQAQTLPARLSFAAVSLLSATGSASAQQAGDRLEVGGPTIYFERHGPREGTPLVLLHGGPGFDHTYFRVSDFWKTLAKHRPLVFYDQRGTGRSSPIDSAEQCKLSDQLADLEALVKALGAPRVYLLGHSWGGYLAMAFVARYAGLVQHLVLVDSAAPKWSETLFLFKEIYPEVEAANQSLAFAEALGDRRDPKASLNDYFSMLFYSPEKRASFIAAAPGFSYSEEVNAALDADVQHFDLGPELPKFALPTLVITGRFDANVAPLTAYKIHQAIPRSRFVVFERSGHLPFMEEPEDFVRLVEEFLDPR